MSIAMVMSSSHLILQCPLLLPSVLLSIRDFSNEWAVYIRWPKCWSFSFSISPSNEYSEVISLRLTSLISLLSKGHLGVFSSTTVQRHQFFHTPPSLWSSSHNCMWSLGRHILDYMDLCWQSNVSAFQHTMFVIAFRPRSKCLLISWLQSPSAVILEPKKRKSSLLPPFPFYLPWRNGAGCHDPSFFNI